LANDEKSLLDALQTRLGTEYFLKYLPVLGKLSGSPNAGLFLCKILYWSGKGKKGGGWVYKTIEQLEHETSLTVSMQDTARKRLLALEFIEQRNEGIFNRRHFRPNVPNIVRAYTALPKEEQQHWRFPDKYFGEDPQTTKNTLKKTQRFFTKNEGLKNKLDELAKRKKLQ
jgi:hypothetical protein